MSDPSRGRGGTKKVAAPRGRGRRTQADRDQLSQAEKERTKARESEFALERAAKAAAEKHQKELARFGRDGNRRLGRGGYMGERNPATPSGPFSAGSVFQPSAKIGKAYPRPWAPSKRASRASASSSKVKVEDDDQPIASGRKQPDFSDIIDIEDVKPEDGGYISSDPEEEGEGARKDIDFINLVSEDEEEAEGGAARDSPALFPVRIQRVEHKDRAPAVNPDASSATAKAKRRDSEGDVVLEESPTKPSQKGKQRARDAEPAPSQRRWRGVYEDDSDVMIEESHAEEQIQPPISPKHSRSPEKAKRKPRSHPENLLFQTEEDKQEYFRRQKQIAVLLDELGGVDLDGEPRDTSGGERDQKSDRVYIFQFPSKLPDLINASAAVKEEPSSPQTLASHAPAAAASSSAAAPTQSQSQLPPPTIKIEDDAPNANSASQVSPLAPVRPAHRPVLAPGYLGKLRIHKSGKATLDWGGTSLVVSKGLDESILQDVVVVRPKPIPVDVAQNGDGGEASAAAGKAGSSARKELEKEEYGGEALAFGQVRGKFVVTPDWDELWG